MSLSVSDFFLACTLINFSVLTFWALMIAVAGNWVFNLHSRLFGLPVESIKTTHFRVMAQYKVATLLFNLAPWLALEIIS